MPFVRARHALAVAGFSALAGASGCSSEPTMGTTVRSSSETHRSRGLEKVVRLAGTVEAVRAHSAIVPRLVGQPTGSGSLLLTRLAPTGTRANLGEVLAEFDRQEQDRIARDRRSELLDLDEQIRKKKSEQAVARAHDETELKQAENDVGRARLDVQRNPLLPRIDAEKNDLALEQAQARLAQLAAAFTLKRRAAGAELRILEIRRDRAKAEADHAERNARLMTIVAPFAGIVVRKTTFRGPGQMSELHVGEEVRPGAPILDLVDSSAMQVRARVNQADIAWVTAGQRARVRLDAYPDLDFEGRVEQLAPLAVASTMTPRVREFVALISITGTHPSLMPDLSAAVDIVVPDATSNETMAVAPALRLAAR
jgi:HlyD family secretion protein